MASSYHEHTDPELLQLLTRDDAAPAAFDILYERYWEPLYQY